MSAESSYAEGRETAVFEVMIEGTIDDVWHEITKTDELQGAIFNARMHTTGLEPGGAVQMRTGSGKFTNMVGHVLEFAPPRRFVHTMKFTANEDPESIVEYDLEEVGKEVRFRLTVHMPPGTKSAKQMKQGGTMIVNSLKRIVETGRPSMGVRMLYGLFKVLEPVAPKRCKSENWPLEARS
ncbi:MAG: SRPBCC domain-containing protein [Planctomycetota bacterium]